MEAPHNAVDFILKKAADFAKAKSQRVHLEEFRKSKKALLMKRAMLQGVQIVSAQEREAYADPEYQELVKGLAEAIEQEETLKWQLEAARMRIDIWRTQEATERMAMKASE